MPDFAEVAPNVSKLVNAEQFAKDFPADSPPADQPPEPDGAGKAALYAEFKVRYNRNGRAVDLRQLAADMGVPDRWCRILMDEVTAGRAVVHAVEDGE